MQYAKAAAARFGQLDVVLFPEDVTVPRNDAAFRGESLARGPTIVSMSALARELGSYVLAPIHEWDTERNTTYNTAVVIGQDGGTVGVYRKSFPTPKEIEEGIVPSPDGVRIFDLDFGRVAVLVCWDEQFPELWHAVGAMGADVVFWPAEGAGGSTPPVFTLSLAEP